jgi:hypothetical protein
MTGSVKTIRRVLSVRRRLSDDQKTFTVPSRQCYRMCMSKTQVQSITTLQDNLRRCETVSIQKSKCNKPFVRLIKPGQLTSVVTDVFKDNPAVP